MSKNPDLANFLLHKKSVSTKKFVKSVFYVIFTVVKSVDYCIRILHIVKVVKLTYGLPEGVPESSPPLVPLFYAQVTRCFDLDGINAEFIVMVSSDETSSEINIF